LAKLNRPQVVSSASQARAYQVYEQRGKIDGHAEEDWLQAEAEILAETKTAN